jgi:hypothetical protein
MEADRRKGEWGTGILRFRCLTPITIYMVLEIENALETDVLRNIRIQEDILR